MRQPIIYILLFFALVINLNLQAQSGLFCEVTINKSSAYVGEPIELSVFVYTPTWFTKGVDPGNIKVNGAFTIYFRSVSQTKIIKGNTFAGVQMIYNVFPYDDDNLIIPEIEINVETPDIGGYKGIRRVVKTKENKINIKPIPKSYNSNLWLVADNLSVTESWIGDINNVKVGDVIERKISISVSGTVSELIPPIIWDTISGVSFYPNRADVKSNKTKTSISAIRIESMRYLFEKEGEIIIPELVFTWWDPTKNKLFKRTLMAVEFDVLPNPNLGILESIRDSLQLASAIGTSGETKNEEINILGFSIRDFVIGLIILLIIIVLTIKIAGLMINWKKKKHQLYIISEKYYFDLFIIEVKKGNGKSIINSMYLWLDKVNINPRTIRYLHSLYGTKELLIDIEKLENQVGKNEQGMISLNISAWKKCRNRYINNHKSKDNLNAFSAINP